MCEETQKDVNSQISNVCLLTDTQTNKETNSHAADSTPAAPAAWGRPQPKSISGDFAPKYNYRCKITSSGKNFSFADDCIFIRNELRDACGIKGLWVGSRGAATRSSEQT